MIFSRAISENSTFFLPVFLPGDDDDADAAEVAAALWRESMLSVVLTSVSLSRK